jgi:hypothetical protein
MSSQTQIQTRTMDTAMHMLGKVAPPDALIHIGAGTGHGPLHQWQNWPLELAVLIDGDSEKLAWAKAKGSQETWHVLGQVVGPQTGSQTWYKASISRESGLLAPEKLNDLWPNLSTRKQEEVTAKSLADCLEQTPFSKVTGCVWTILDCLPALPLLQGAENILAHCQVIAARVLLPPQDESDRQDASLNYLEAWLEARGFQCVQTVETLHPDLGYCFFARNWPEETRIRTRERDAKAKEAADTHKQLDELGQAKGQLEKDLGARTKERDAKAKQVQELTGERDAKAKQIQELTKERDAKAKEAQDLTKERDAQSKQVQDLTKQRDAKAKEAQDRQEQLKKVQTEKDNALSRIKELEQQKSDAVQKYQHQEQQSREDAYRQSQLQEELTRAEAQIELIKDLLLREQGL